MTDKMFRDLPDFRDSKPVEEKKPVRDAWWEHDVDEAFSDPDQRELMKNIGVRLFHAEHKLARLRQALERKGVIERD